MINKIGTPRRWSIVVTLRFTFLLLSYVRHNGRVRNFGISWTSGGLCEEVIGLFRNRKFLVRSKGGKTKTTRGSRVIIDEGLRRESRGGVRVESGVRARDEGRIRDVWTWSIPVFFHSREERERKRVHITRQFLSSTGNRASNQRFNQTLHFAIIAWNRIRRIGRDRVGRASTSLSLSLSLPIRSYPPYPFNAVKRSTRFAAL